MSGPPQADPMDDSAEVSGEDEFTQPATSRRSNPQVEGSRTSVFGTDDLVDPPRAHPDVVAGTYSRSRGDRTQPTPPVGQRKGTSTQATKRSPTGVKKDVVEPPLPWDKNKVATPPTGQEKVVDKKPSSMSYGEMRRRDEQQTKQLQQQQDALRIAKVLSKPRLASEQQLTGKITSIADMKQQDEQRMQQAEREAGLR